MEALLIQILGNSPTLIAVLLMYAHFEKKCAVLESDLKHVQEEQKKCW